MAILSPYPKFRAFDANGNPLVGAKLHTYEPGTLTPKATFTTAAGTTPNTNPVICDANGEADVWLEGSYRWILTDASDVQQWDIDQINAQVGVTQVYTNVTERTLSAPINTPQVMQSDAIPALSMQPDRALTFQYFGSVIGTVSTNMVVRLKYDSTELFSQSMLMPTSDVAWETHGTILMRNIGRGELYAEQSTWGTTSIISTYAPLSVDLSQAFSLTLELERDDVSVSARLFGSVVQITGG